MRRAPWSIATVVLGLCLLAPSAGAAAPRLHVSLLGCISGETHVAKRQACATVPGVGHESSADSGMQGPNGLLRSGSSLYVLGNRNSAVTQVSAPSPRGLTFAACFTGNSFLRNCVHLPGASANAVEAPIKNPTATAISPDGRHLYLVSGNFHGSTIARFARDQLTGGLTYEGCLSGSLGSGPATPSGCSLLPTATKDGFGSGLKNASGIAISRDGSVVYVTAADDASLVVFARNPATGNLTLRGCMTTSPRTAGCRRVPGERDMLFTVRGPQLSADGRFLHVAVPRSGTVAVFSIGGSEGLGLRQCLSADDDQRPCKGPRGQGPRGRSPLAALHNPGELVESRDGRFLYATSSFGSIVVLRRNRASGALTAGSCVSGREEDRRTCTLVPGHRGIPRVTPLSGVGSPLLRGGQLLAAARSPSGLVAFSRRGARLVFRGCASADLDMSRRRSGPCARLPHATKTGAESGFYKNAVLVRGPGDVVYAAAAQDDTVSALRIRR